MNPNAYLAVAIDYLLAQSAGLAARRRRSARPSSAAACSTASSPGPGRQLCEVPVGFKWFVDGSAELDPVLRRRRKCGCEFPAP